MGTTLSEPCIYDKLSESIDILRQSGYRYGMSEREIEKFIKQVLETNEPRREPTQFPILRAFIKVMSSVALSQAHINWSFLHTYMWVSDMHVCPTAELLSVCDAHVFNSGSAGVVVSVVMCVRESVSARGSVCVWVFVTYSRTVCANSWVCDGHVCV